VSNLDPAPEAISLTPGVVRAVAGYEVAVPGGDDFVLPVREDFEYGVVAVDGSAAGWPGSSWSAGCRSASAC
jgi:hypothetical protein